MSVQSSPRAGAYGAADAAGDSAILFSWASRKSDTSIIRLNARPAGEDEPSAALYLVHGITGTAGSEYIDLARRLARTARVYGIQAPPKRLNDDAFGASIQCLAEFYAEALVRFQPEGRFLLGGWSAGAILALAISQALRARGREVALLVALDWGPENTGADLVKKSPRFWWEVALQVPRWLSYQGPRGLALELKAKGSSVARRFKRLAKAQPPQQILRGAFALEAWDLNRFPRERWQFMIRIFEAMLNYKPESWRDDVVLYEALSGLHPRQARRRWGQVAPQTEIVGVVGDHLSMMKEPCVGAIAADLGRRIASATVGG